MAALADVANLQGVTTERFRTECVPAAKPVILRGFVSSWPARSWSFPRIAEHWPRRAARAVRSAPDGLAVQTLTLTPDELVPQLLADDLRPPYGAPDWRFDVFGELPELAEELPPPRVYAGQPSYLLFLGRDTVQRAHYHAFYHSLICQVHGRKRITLYSPDDSACLYPHPIRRRHFEFSRVDTSAPDLEAFPRFASARPLDAILEPGDALFVPFRWWHAVKGIGAILSTSLFWKAPWRAHLARPNARDLAGTALWFALARMSCRGRCGPRD